MIARGIATRKRAPARKLTVQGCLEFAREALSRPPALERIERADPVGSVLWRFVVPLDWCPGVNPYAEMPNWKRAKLKRDVRDYMLKQHEFRVRRVPLTGRPMVRAVRFSSVECDAHNGWTKLPIDRLTGKHGGLNFLVDDKPKYLDLRPWWEPAPPGRGFCYFEVWSGDV